MDGYSDDGMQPFCETSDKIGLAKQPLVTKDIKLGDIKLGGVDGNGHQIPMRAGRRGTGKEQVYEEDEEEEDDDDDATYQP